MDRFKCHLFDVDGTLIDTSELITRSAIKTIRELKGLAADEEEVGALIKESPKKLLKSYGINDLTYYWKTYEQNISLSKLFHPETRKTLLKLKSRRVRIGIVSSLPKKRITLLFRELHFTNLFDVIIAWQDTPRRKPSPDPILLALRKLGVQAQEATYVGDTENDISAAKSAGVYSILVGWGNENKCVGFKADKTIRHISDLLNL